MKSVLTMAISNRQSEIKLWVKTCLKDENIKKIVVESFKSLDTHEGYMGDIAFVDVKAEDETGPIKTYNLVLKCSKVSKILRETSPAKTMFFNEIHFYENILPEFTKFQKEQGVDKPFDNIPKYYGAYCDDDREVMAFENLHTNGFSLWDKKKPMTRKHINLVIRQYAKFHAISLAMKDRNPEKFETLTEPVTKVIKKFASSGNKMLQNFCRAIEEIHDILRNELDEDILSKWKDFGKSLESKAVPEMLNYDDVKVVSHGDCWNNNFMFQVKDNDKYQPTRVSILDWQIAKLVSPAVDLAHFLFSTISKEGIRDLPSILDEYYAILSENIVKLKSDPNIIYSKEKFLQNWKRYSRMGIFVISLTMKMCGVDPEEVIDIGEAAESGHFTDAFRVEVKNKTFLRDRMKHVVKYVVENGLVEV